MGKENILGLISVRQIQHDNKGNVFVKEKSSHIAGTCIVSVDYPLFDSLTNFRKEITRRFKLVKVLDKIDDLKRYDTGLKEALNEAKRYDNRKGITFIEDWKKPAVESGTKVRL